MLQFTNLQQNQYADDNYHHCSTKHQADVPDDL